MNARVDSPRDRVVVNDLIRVAGRDTRERNDFFSRMLSSEGISIPRRLSGKRSLESAVRKFAERGIDERFVRALLVGTASERKKVVDEVLDFDASLFLPKKFSGLFKATLKEYEEINGLLRLFRLFKGRISAPERELRDLALGILGMIASASAEWRECVRSGSSSADMVPCALCLLRFRVSGAVPDLMTAFRNSNSTSFVQTFAFVLGAMKTPEAVDFLMSEFPKSNSHLRHVIAHALGLSEDARAVPFLMDAYKKSLRARYTEDLPLTATVGGVQLVESPALFAIAMIGDLRALDLMIKDLEKTGFTSIGSLIMLSGKHPDEVLEAVRRLYLKVRESKPRVRDACMLIMTTIHSENLKTESECPQLGKHPKEWGHEFFEIVEAQRMGWTTMHFKPRTKPRMDDGRSYVNGKDDEYVELNPESDLSHHFVGEGADREFCYSTSFHTHPQKHVGIKVAVGRVKIVFGHDKQEKILEAGDNAFSLAPGVPHQIINIGEVRGNRDEWAIVTEIESPAFKDDIIRLENPYKTEKKASGY